MMQKSQDYPSIGEFYKARETFMQAFQHQYASGNSKEVAIRCALAAVWEAARQYQVQLEVTEQNYFKEISA